MPSLLFRAIPLIAAGAVLAGAALAGSGYLSGPASAAADVLGDLVADGAGDDPQTAYTLRLHAEVATEAACMAPVDQDMPVSVAALSEQDRAAYCLCFARTVVRNAPPGDQMDLIDAQGVPGHSLAAEARQTCLPDHH
jgi:hypothetical protein